MTVVISNGQTVTVDSTENQDYLIKNGTLDVVSGGQVNGQPDSNAAVTAQSNQAVNVSGGAIVGGGGSKATLGEIAVLGGKVTVSGGSVTGGQAGNTAAPAITKASVVVTGGEITGGHGGTLGGAGISESVVDLQDGAVSGGSAGNSGGAGVRKCRLTMTGGQVTGGHGGTVMGSAILGGEITLEGGVVSGGVSQTSSFDMSGGQVTGSLDLRYGPATISGGSIGGGITTSGFASVTVHGGTFSGGQSLYLTQGSAAHISGGQWSGTWKLIQSSRAYVEGTGLVQENGRLTGTLSDGSPIDVGLELVQGSQVVITND